MSESIDGLAVVAIMRDEARIWTSGVEPGTKPESLHSPVKRPVTITCAKPSITMATIPTIAVRLLRVNLGVGGYGPDDPLGWSW